MAPLTIWLTDRSRYTTGTGHCKKLRYLKNHFGPTGYGIVRKAESLPLMTGKSVHTALEGIFKHLQKEDALPDDRLVRYEIERVTEKYQEEIDARGFAGVLNSERVQEIITEQQALVTGLVWSAMRAIIPWLHKEFKILAVETETIYMLGCTCGLGSSVAAEEHDARDCQGIGQMLRQDVIAERRDNGNLAYLEFKTTGWAGDAWSSQWETKPQLAIGAFGIEERFGKQLTECYIVGLYKGYRKKAEVITPRGLETIQRQESPLCYGYCRPGNPPLAPDDWVPSYEWVDELGVTKRKSRAHEKRGVWELVGSDAAPEEVQTGKISAAEWWAREFLPDSVVQKQVFLIGPMAPQQAQQEALKRQIVGEEDHWREILWEIYNFQTKTGLGWADPAVQAKIDYLIPASWECRKFGKDHQCEMVPICFKQAGWEDPLATGKWVPRRPHHQPELDQAVARGLLVADAAEGEDENE